MIKQQPYPAGIICMTRRLANYVTEPAHSCPSSDAARAGARGYSQLVDSGAGLHHHHASPSHHNGSPANGSECAALARFTLQVVTLRATDEMAQMVGDLISGAMGRNCSAGGVAEQCPLPWCVPRSLTARPVALRASVPSCLFLEQQQRACARACA